MKRLSVFVALLLSGCSAHLQGTTVTPAELVQAVNEDRKSITILAESVQQVIKKINELEDEKNEL